MKNKSCMEFQQTLKAGSHWRILWIFSVSPRSYLPRGGAAYAFGPSEWILQHVGVFATIDGSRSSDEKKGGTEQDKSIVGTKPNATFCVNRITCFSDSAWPFSALQPFNQHQHHHEHQDLQSPYFVKGNSKAPSTCRAIHCLQKNEQM